MFVEYCKPTNATFNVVQWKGSQIPVAIRSTQTQKNKWQPTVIYVQHYIHLDKREEGISYPSPPPLREPPSSMGSSILVLDLSTCAQYGQMDSNSKMSLHSVSGQSTLLYEEVVIWGQRPHVL